MGARNVTPCRPQRCSAGWGAPWGLQSGPRDGEEEAPGGGGRGGPAWAKGRMEELVGRRSGPGRFPQPLGLRVCVSPADFKVTRGRGLGRGGVGEGGAWGAPEKRLC